MLKNIFVLIAVCIMFIVSSIACYALSIDLLGIKYTGNVLSIAYVRNRTTVPFDKYFDMIYVVFKVKESGDVIFVAYTEPRGSGGASAGVTKIKKWDNRSDSCNYDVKVIGVTYSKYNIFRDGSKTFTKSVNSDINVWSIIVEIDNKFFAVTYTEQVGSKTSGVGITTLVE